MTLMTASFGSSADRRRRVPRTGRAARTVALAVAALVLAGCSGASGDSGGGGTAKTPKSRPDEGMRTTIKTALTQAGRTTEADIVTRGGTRLTPVQAPFLKTWKIIQVDYRQGAHPVMFHVAVGGSQAQLLTGTPEAFGRVTAADGTQVTDAASAAQVGRTFLETTRPPGKLTYVVGNVNEIKFRPGISGSAAQRRDEIVAKYGTVVRPLTAGAPKGAVFTVTAFVVQDRELQERSLLVNRQGSVTEQSRTLVPDLPTPYVL
jgi:hypothetical protein